MFTGIDDVDWASLRHAHGSAEDVPGWLRALASADATEREAALDSMYGVVHHRGKVYDSTLASVPFLLRLAAHEEVPDRGCLVELLVSVGAESGDTRAREAVRAGAEVFTSLAGDPDAGVRRAAAGAVVRFLDDPPRVLALLRLRAAAERDDLVLPALTEALGLFIRRCPGHAPDAVELLAAQSAPPWAPTPRLAALGQLALHAPGRRNAELVPTAVRLLRERSARRAGTPGRPGDDTLVTRIRRLRPSDEEGARLLRTLHTALGDRVGERVDLLEGQLGSPDPMDRCNAVWMTAALYRALRPGSEGPIALVGHQLHAEQDWLRDAAVSVLTDLCALAAPAADDLHALVRSRPDLWTLRRERNAPTLGGPLKALVRSGDSRAVPVLAHILAGPYAPAGLGSEIAFLGRAAAPLAAELRHRLGRITLDSPAAGHLAAPLLTALGAIGDAEAAPEVLRLLSGAPDGLGARDRIAGQVIGTLDAFGAAGPAVPLLRALLTTRHASVAAGALWSVDGDAGAVLPVLRGELARDAADARIAAAGQLGRLGPAGREALPELLAMTSSERVRERTAAAAALWHVGGDPDPVLPVFRAAWSAHPGERGPIARCLTAMGAAAAPLRDLVRAELESVRRHTAVAGGDGAHGGGVADDEALLTACRTLLAEEGPAAYASGPGGGPLRD
ncbi:HEAT repeat domain-containing protein [Streptomyces sp. NPDC005573]|uniref:HEAT repeat domain-containing protein n=1 Tax=Streptomyces sp. NPDC005573 TaxID=3156890 RepID=UPI0033BCE6C2